MNEARLRIIFIAVLAFSVFSILTGAHLYPSVRFPQFPNKKMGKQVSYHEIHFFSLRDKREICLMSLIKPYDKQYYLFSQRDLVNNESSGNAFRYIDKLYRTKCKNEDSLYFSVQLKTVEMP